MTDKPPVRRDPMNELRLGDPQMFARRFGRDWTLSVVEAFDVTPGMRRVRFTADNLDQFDHQPGQEVIVMLPQPEGGSARRHYTVRSCDRANKTLDVDFVLHGDSPALRFARTAKAGDPLHVVGPRGRIFPRPDADWFLFAGDETALPAILHMAETLPAGAKATVLLEMGSQQDQQPLQSRAEIDLRWLPRDVPAGHGRALIAAVAGFSLPAGSGHAFTLGETGMVRALRQGLIARGMAKERISAEGYWRPGRIGGHDHVDDDH